MSKTVNNQILGAWVLKCNPKVYNLFEIIESGETQIENWSVYPNYRSKMMSAGDSVVLWVSGSNQPGVWGIGEISGPCLTPQELGIEPNVAGWKDQNALKKVRLFAQTNIDILNSPIEKRVLRSTPGLAECEIFRSPQMANPSFLTQKEFEILKTHIK